MTTTPRTAARATAALLAVALLATLGAGLAPSAATAAAPAQPQAAVASAVPSKLSPSVLNGTIKALIQIGGRIYAGGTFTTVASAGSTTSITRNYVMAFDATTGVVDPNFAPVVDGEVDSILAAPDGTSVYLAGKFNKVAGLKSKSLVAVDLNTGATVSSFKVPAVDGVITDLALSGGRLYLAGTFVHLNATVHAGIAAVNPATAAVDPFMSLQLSGHHNYGKNGNLSAGVGALKFDVTPDGSRLIAIGNFTQASGYDRDQIVMVDLTGPAAAVSTSWTTSSFTPPCFAWAYDSYMRGVQFSPDGSYFVVVTTGGSYAGAHQACDAASRFETGASSADVRPTWVDEAGADSLYAVAVTGTAVYVGGHQRWLNNSYGQDSPGPGAVPRPGLAALDPATGLPLAWNPGRNPRGHGLETLLATPAGVWTGSDTEYIGNYAYKRPRIAFFPLAGGKALPTTFNTGTLPGNVIAAGVTSNGTATDTVTGRSYNGSSVTATATIDGAGVAWSQARGAFEVNGKLYYGMADGNLYSRNFNGKTFGTVVNVLDPYNDATWSNVQTGSGQTYRGQRSTFSNELPNVTGMAYANSTIYYTVAGDPALHSRPFSLDSGIVGPTSTVVDTTVDWSDAGGMFLAGGNLYVASRTTGNLNRIGFSGGQVTSSATTVGGPTIDGQDWRSQAPFLQAA